MTGVGYPITKTDASVQVARWIAGANVTWRTDMKLIMTVVKNVYGNDLEYIVYPEKAAKHFEQLTGKKTINESDKEALSKLGEIQFENYSEQWQSAINYLKKERKNE